MPYIHMNQPWVYMCSPSWHSLPPPSPSHPSGLSHCTSLEHPASCIEPGLAMYFTYGNIHVSVLFSQIIPPSPSPTESKGLFFISVSLLLSRIYGHRYHLSKFHTYALIYCIGVFLSDFFWLFSWLLSLPVFLNPPSLWPLPRVEVLTPAPCNSVIKNEFESVQMRWMKLEPIIQSEVKQKQKHQYSILMHIYGI